MTTKIFRNENNNFMVSTVFYAGTFDGINTFETMAFAKRNGKIDFGELICYRATNLMDATANHLKAVSALCDLPAIELVQETPADPEPSCFEGDDELEALFAELSDDDIEPCTEEENAFWEAVMAM